MTLLNEYLYINTGFLCYFFYFFDVEGPDDLLLFPLKYFLLLT